MNKLCDNEDIIIDKRNNLPDIKFLIFITSFYSNTYYDTIGVNDAQETS